MTYTIDPVRAGTRAPDFLLLHPTVLYFLSRHKRHKLLHHLTSLTMPPKEAKPLAKWSNRTKAYKILKEGLLDGTIDSTMKPKDVYESNNDFLKYSLVSFRSAFNRMKAELGVHVRDEGKRQ
jgi:hypothetical protein